MLLEKASISGALFARGKRQLARVERALYEFGGRKRRRRAEADYSTKRSRKKTKRKCKCCLLFFF